MLGKGAAEPIRCRPRPVRPRRVGSAACRPRTAARAPISARRVVLSRRSNSSWARKARPSRSAPRRARNGPADGSDPEPAGGGALDCVDEAGPLATARSRRLREPPLHRVGRLRCSKRAVPHMRCSAAPSAPIRKIRRRAAHPARHDVPFPCGRSSTTALHPHHSHQLPASSTLQRTTTLPGRGKRAILPRWCRARGHHAERLRARRRMSIARFDPHARERNVRSSGPATWVYVCRRALRSGFCAASEANRPSSAPYRRRRLSCEVDQALGPPPQVFAGIDRAHHSSRPGALLLV